MSSAGDQERRLELPSIEMVVRSAAAVFLGLVLDEEAEVIDEVLRSGLESHDLEGGQSEARGRSHWVGRELKDSLASLPSPPTETPGTVIDRLPVRSCQDACAGTYEVVVPIWTEGGCSERGLVVHLTPWPGEETLLDLEGLAMVTIEPMPEGPLEAIAPRPQDRRRLDVAPPDERIPTAWRPMLRTIVSLLVANDVESLVASGFVRYDPHEDGSNITRFIDAHPSRIIELPEQAWDHASAFSDPEPPGSWTAWVPLWTAEEGPSDLVMEVWVQEEEGVLRMELATAPHVT